MGTIGSILFQQILVMFLLIAVGYVLFKGKLVSIEGSKTLSNILLYAVSPCLIINAYSIERTPERVNGVLISFALAALGLFLSIVVSRFFFGSKKRRQSHSLEHFGEEAVLYVSAFVAFLNILQWTYGVVVITQSREAIRPKKIFQNPVILSMVLSMLIFFFQIPLPEVLGRTIAYVGNLNAPLAMMILGTYLAQTELLSIFRVPRLYVASFLRLVVIPLLTIAVFCLVPDAFYEAKMATLIAASAPIGANVALFAQLNGKDYTYAVKEVCLCTLLCLFTMPFVMTLAEWLWK